MVIFPRFLGNQTRGNIEAKFERERESESFKLGFGSESESIGFWRGFVSGGQIWANL